MYEFSFFLIAWGAIMPQKRIDKILDILKEQGYVTVKYLTEELHYSTATINRDLNDLQKQKLIRRHYGGAELIEQRTTPLVFRYHKMRPIKRLIAKKAAEFIENGDTVFIDCSTTCQCMAEFLTDKKELTVITNNLLMASFLSENGIRVICLGGEIVEIPYMLGGDAAAESALGYKADKLFFASGGITENGIISDTDTYHLLRRIMIKNSDTAFYLADHGKLNKEFTRNLCSLSEIDYVICDYDFPEALKSEYNTVKFVNPITNRK